MKRIYLEILLNQFFGFENSLKEQMSDAMKAIENFIANSTNCS